jgi:hypothetical protein
MWVGHSCPMPLVLDFLQPETKFDDKASDKSVRPTQVHPATFFCNIGAGHLEDT